jgi:hypothetical protein
MAINFQLVIDCADPDRVRLPGLALPLDVGKVQRRHCVQVASFVVATDISHKFPC